MPRIIGNTTATPNPRPDWAQTDETKADYIKNKPQLGILAAKDEVAKSDLTADVQSSINKANTAIQSLNGYATESFVKLQVAENDLQVNDDNAGNVTFNSGSPVDNFVLAELVQTTGNSATAVMSQKAVTGLIGDSLRLQGLKNGVACVSCTVANGTAWNPNNAKHVCTEEYVPVKEGDYVTFEIADTAPPAGYHYGLGYLTYDKDKTYIRAVDPTSQRTEIKDLVMPEGVAYFRASVGLFDSNDVLQTIRKTDFSPYEFKVYITNEMSPNVKISGLENKVAQLSELGFCKNLLGTELGRLYRIPTLHKGDVITISTHDGEASDVNREFRFYDANKNYLDYWSFGPSTGAKRTVTMSDSHNGAQYVQEFGSVSPRGVKFQIEIGDTKTDFVEYYPNTQVVYDDVLENASNIDKISEAVGTGKSINSFNPAYKMDEKLQQLNRAKYGDEKRILTLLHFSDIHNSNANLQRVIDFYNTHSSHIDGLIHTGDGVVYYGSENPFASIGGDMVMNVIGNHECWIKGDTAPMPYNATAKQVYEKFMAPFIDSWGVVSAGVDLCYYYKDYPTEKIRLVVIDCLHFDETQETWLLNTLEDARTKGYSVLGATHYPPQTGMNAIDCTFASIDQTPLAQTPSAGYQMERTPESAYTAVDTFIDNGGEFICWIGGHTHYDHIGTVVNHESQICVIVNTAHVDIYGDEARKADTKTQDCFNIIAFDQTSKLIKIVRVGTSVDHYLRSKETLCLKYTDGSVISNT